MKVIFSHGMESGPWGTKIQRLSRLAADRNLEVESVDYTDTMDAQVRVNKLNGLLKQEREDRILVGSSMGGYVSLVASATNPVKGLFLMAPAVFVDGYPVQSYVTQSPVVDIVHGWNDDIIPFENAIRLAKEFGHSLHLLNGNHALSDVLEDVDRVFVQFLGRVLD